LRIKSVLTWISTRTLPGWGFTKVGAAIELLHQVLPSLPHFASHLDEHIYSPIREGVPIKIDESLLSTKYPFLKVLLDACTGTMESQGESIEGRSSRAQTVTSEG
jgi:hypothetical protein